MAETESAVFSIHINGTKEAVWKEITRTDKPHDAMFHTVLHTAGLQPGAEYQMRTPDGRFVNAIGEILEYDPPNRLQQTVQFVRTDDPAVTATYDIADAPQGGVDLTLTIDDIVPGTATAKTWKGSGGGEFTCKTIKEIAEDGRASRSTRAMYRIFYIFAPVISRIATPKRMRAENWPMKD